MAPLKLVATRQYFSQNFKLFTKAQILFRQLFTKSQYCFGNYLQKPNAILATIYKKPNTTLATLFWHLLSKRKEKKKNPKLLGKQLFYQSPNVIRQKNYIMLKTQNYSLAKTYFDIQNPQTYGKYKLLMTYYPSGP